MKRDDNHDGMPPTRAPEESDVDAATGDDPFLEMLRHELAKEALAAYEPTPRARPEIPAIRFGCDPTARRAPPSGSGGSVSAMRWGRSRSHSAQTAEIAASSQGNARGPMGS